MYSCSVIEGWVSSAAISSVCWRCCINKATLESSPAASYVPFRICSALGPSPQYPTSTASGVIVNGEPLACPKCFRFRCWRWNNTSVGTSICCHSVHDLGSTSGCNGISIRVTPLRASGARSGLSLRNRALMSSAFLNRRRILALFLSYGEGDSSKSRIFSRCSRSRWA